MAQTDVNGLSNGERARKWYDQLKTEIETTPNIGKLVSIDLETGDYVIGDDVSLTAPQTLRQNNPDADVFTLRIGYHAVYTFGGVLGRIDS